MPKVGSKKKEEGKDEGIKYEIIKHVELLSEQTNGWRKELNIVQWGDNEPKYDLRTWKRDEEGNIQRMGKGITFDEEEAQLLMQALQKEFSYDDDEEDEESEYEITEQGDD
jgi:hypothetical protein